MAFPKSMVLCKSQDDKWQQIKTLICFITFSLDTKKGRKHVKYLFHYYILTINNCSELWPLNSLLGLDLTVWSPVLNCDINLCCDWQLPVPDLTINLPRPSRPPKNLCCAISSGLQALQYLRKLCNHPALVLTKQHPEYDNVVSRLKKQGTSLHDLDLAPKLTALRSVW